MKALLVGLGGIGKNVYLPQLEQLGYTVTTVDLNVKSDYNSVDEINDKFDVAVICTPNFTHSFIAQSIAEMCKVVFIEKPGLPSADQWVSLTKTYPKTKFIMCKNNLYRNDYGSLQSYLESNIKPIKIEIVWENSNRVPSPGTWFTNRASSWGGVALDLFPHLYCLLSKIASPDQLERTHHTMVQMWKLEDLLSTNYGNVNPNGIYDVSDFAEETLVWGNVPINIRASWKTGIDDQAIRVYTEDSTFEWRFGLCPDYAYGNMIKHGLTDSYENHVAMDTWIHKQLEVYHEG